MVSAPFLWSRSLRRIALQEPVTRPQTGFMLEKPRVAESSVPLESKAYHQGLMAFSSPPPLQTVSNSVMLLGMGWPNIYCRVSINYVLYMPLFEKEGGPLELDS